MKKIAIVCSLCLLVLSTSAATALESIEPQSPVVIPNDLGTVPDEFILVLEPGAQIDDPGIAALESRFDVVGVRPQFPLAAERGIDLLGRHFKIRFDARHDLETVLGAFAASPAVERVERIGIHPVYAMPNDGFFGDQWHLNQASDHDVDGPEAWDIETGDPSVIVAILDTGVRYYHKDLGGVNASVSNPSASRGSNWINTAESNGTTGVDDDGNGYVDDWVGYDFVDGATQCWSGEDCNGQDNDPRDFNGHGTHCAGNVAAMNNNGYATCAPSGGWGNGGLAEFGNGVEAMACRVGWSGIYFGQEVGYVRMDFCAEAFYYAADNGARIASCSWGSSNSGGIGSAVTYFTNAGGLVFKAAGNDGGQTADYLCGRSDVISVAATDASDCKASFSTYGTWVDISAPGVDIVSLYHVHSDPNNDYVATVSGTSMATPLAASVAALIWSHNPGWSASQVEQRLYDTADPIDGLGCNASYAGKLGAGRINAFNAVNSGTPPPVAAFSGTPTSGCLPLTVDFTDESTGDMTSWDWDFGDGGTSTAQNPSHTYTSAQIFTVSLTVTGPGGSDTDTKVGYITVSDLPTADFSATPTTGTAPLTVDFTDLTTGNPTSWSWDFGDTGTSTQQNPAHTYTAEGDYTVSLTATNGCGGDTMVKNAYIHVSPPSPLALALSDIAVTGTVSGSYVDTHGSDDVREVITEVSSQTHPRKWYSMLDHRWDFQVAAGTSVTFTVEAYRPNNSDGDDFAFEYSTDNVTFLPLVTVASAVEQIYSTAMPGNLVGTVYVRVADTNRQNSRQSLDSIFIDQIYIESTTSTNPPVADFVGDPTTGYAPLAVQFTDLSSNGPTSWSWDFGDSGTSTLQNPAHTYANPGLYTVTLIATNPYGADPETKLDYIEVLEPQTGMMHVHDMVVDRKVAGPNENGRCVVTIHDSAEAPVSGATVFVTATGPTGGNYSGVTAVDGTVEFQTSKTKNPVGEWCFEVTNVTHTSLTYDAAANHVTLACESGWMYGNGGGVVQLPRTTGLVGANVPAAGGQGTILFDLATPSHIRLDLYDVAGVRIARLLDETRPAGRHAAFFDTGRLSSGVYFYRLATEQGIESRKVLVMR